MVEKKLIPHKINKLRLRRGPIFNYFFVPGFLTCGFFHLRQAMSFVSLKREQVCLAHINFPVMSLAFLRQKVLTQVLFVLIFALRQPATSQTASCTVSVLPEHFSLQLSPWTIATQDSTQDSEC